MTSTQGRSEVYTVDDFVQVDTATEPGFTADGKALIFLSGRSGVRQVYVVGIEGEGVSPAEKLTATEGLVYHAEVRPGHNQTLFITDDGGDEQYQINLLDLSNAKTEVLASSPDVIRPRR